MKTSYEKATCYTCDKNGKVRQYVVGACPVCHGEKKVALPDRVQKKCWDCGGSGKRKGKTCHACAGKGIRMVIVKVPCRKCAATGIVQYKSDVLPRIPCPVCKGSKQISAAPLVNMGDLISIALNKGVHATV